MIGILRKLKAVTTKRALRGKFVIFVDDESPVRFKLDDPEAVSPFWTLIGVCILIFAQLSGPLVSHFFESTPCPRPLLRDRILVANERQLRETDDRSLSCGKHIIRRCGLVISPLDVSCN